MKSDIKEQFGDDLSKNSSAYWIIFIFTITIYIAALIVSDFVRQMTLQALGFIFSDWQVFAAFITVFFFYIAWTMIEGIAKFTLFLYLRYPRTYAYLKQATRTGIISYFLTCLLFRYITIWDFEDIWLYVSSAVLSGVFLFMYFRSPRFKKSVMNSLEKKQANLDRADYYQHFYIRFEQVILVAAIVGGSLIFMFYYGTGTVPWITELVDVVIPGFFTNPFILVLFIMLTCVTLFNPLFEFLADLLPPLLGQKALSYQTKLRIKRARIWSLLFLVIVLIIKLIPSWEIDPWAKDLLSIIALFLSWAISMYRNKLLHSK